MHPGRVEGKHSTGPGEVSEKCRQAQDGGSQAKNWQPSLCQGKVLQNLGPYDVIGKPGTPSPSISHASSAPSTQSFMYHNWNPHDPTHFLSNSSHHHCCYRLMEMG